MEVKDDVQCLNIHGMSKFSSIMFECNADYTPQPAECPPPTDCNQTPLTKYLVDISAFGIGEVTTVSTDKVDFTGTVFTLTSDFTLDSDIEIHENEILLIAEGATFTVPAAYTVTAHGIVINRGNLDNQGTIAGYPHYIAMEGQELPTKGGIYNEATGNVFNNYNGTIFLSFGNMVNNGGNGIVGLNSGVIQQNYGRIDWNDCGVGINMESGSIMNTDGDSTRDPECGVGENLGHIAVVLGDVNANMGVIYANYGTIQQNDVLVYNNHGTVVLNKEGGVVQVNHDGGLITEDLNPEENEDDLPTGSK
jgi:hypothetical protein